jgi:hypothetical protein
MIYLREFWRKSIRDVGKAAYLVLVFSSALNILFIRSGLDAEGELDTRSPEPLSVGSLLTSAKGKAAGGAGSIVGSLLPGAISEGVDAVEHLFNRSVTERSVLFNREVELD